MLEQQYILTNLGNILYLLFLFILMFLELF